MGFKEETELQTEQREQTNKQKKGKRAAASENEGEGDDTQCKPQWVSLKTGGKTTTTTTKKKNNNTKKTRSRRMATTKLESRLAERVFVEDKDLLFGSSAPSLANGCLQT